jgi:hypothetical protein
MDIEEKFRIIERHYKEVDEKVKAKEGKPFFDTTHGIWGASCMLDVYELFLKIKLNERKGFVDLGSGDGRIALIAALFTDACGIEADLSLCEIAKRVQKDLVHKIPELLRCVFVHADYTKINLSKYNILFTFADHSWSADFEKKLLNECQGTLLSYNKIFLPKMLKKGKTYWIQQLPIISYPLNTEEEVLF